MTYVVTESCIRCKYKDCVLVCPVDCFHEGQSMLVIDPHECIDCAVCEPACPVQAIVPDSESGIERWLELNERYAPLWPVVKAKTGVPADADEHRGEAGKFEKYFSGAPGG
jgi:ferredoxin